LVIYQESCGIFVCVIVDLQTETIAKTTWPFLFFSLFTYCSRSF